MEPGTSGTGLRVAAGACARAVLVLSVLAGVGFALRDVVQLENETPAGARRMAWSSSEEDRMRSALAGWYPIVEGVRRSTPRRAVIWCWTVYPAPSGVLSDLVDLLRAVFAPRLSLPALSEEFMASWQERVASSGLPVYFLDVHPSFAPEPPETRPPLARLAGMLEQPVVQAHPDFTLRKLESGR